MEKFSCAVDTNYATHKSYVEKTCFSFYDDAFNSPVRFYAFVVLSYGSVILVSVVYSLVVGNHIDETERYSRGSDGSQTVNEPGRKTFYVFYFYFIHIVVRSMLGILFSILQHTVLYPSGFDSQFSCVYPELRQSDHNITAVKNTSIIQPNVTCTASTAQDKQFWGTFVSACNIIFAIITLLEVIYLIGYQFLNCFKAQSDATWSCDSQFITEYFLRKQYVPENTAFTGVDKCTPRSSNIYKQKVLRDSLTSDINYGPCKSLDDMFIEVVIQTGQTSPKFEKPIQRHEMYDVYMKVPEHSICLEEIKDLFYPEKDTGGKFPQTILALGRPGIGKTVLSRKIRCDWAKEDVDHDKFYHGKIAFFFKFRWFGFKTLQNVTLKKFLQLGTELKEGQFESIFEEIWENPQNAILIFDGLDECGCNSEKFQNFQDEARMVTSDPSCPMSAMFLFIKIMSADMLPGATVLVTSRPTALDISSKLKFDRTVEIIGFTSDKIEKYVEQFCANKNKTDLKLKIWSHIESSSELKNLCYIPVNCFIVCVSLSQCLDDSQEHLPTTLTELYEVALNYFKIHHDRNQDKGCYEKVLKELQELAFNGMKNDTLVFPGQLVDEEMKESGLLHCLSNPIFVIQTQVCFIHLTVQEFLAAKHILETKEPEEIESFISSHVKIGKWHLVLQFLAGLLRRKMEVSDRYRSCVSVFARSVALTHGCICKLDVDQILLMKCLRETEDEGIAKETATSSALKDATTIRSFQNTLSPSDWAAVAFVCKHLSNLTRFLVRRQTLHSVEATRLLKERCIKCVSFRFSDLGDLGLEHLLSALMNSECHVNHRHSKLTELALRGNGITDSGVLHLTKFLKSSHGSCIKRLDLAINQITPCGIGKLGEVLGNEVCGQLTQLHLSNNVIGDDGVGILCKTLIEKQFKLKTLCLSGCRLTSEGIPWLVKVLSDEHCEITHLSLSGNKLRNDGVRKLCRALLNEQCNLAKLNLSGCSLTHECTTALLEALGSGCCGLEKLFLDGNKIGDDGVAMLCCAVRKDQCKLTELSIRQCALTDKCMPSLCGALGDVHCRLTTLDLRKNAFSDKHLLLLTHTLRHQHCCLKNLYFYQGNDVTEEGKRLLRDVEKSQHCKARGLEIRL